jgi:hypothetical protein
MHRWVDLKNPVFRKEFYENPAGCLAPWEVLHSFKFVDEESVI